MDEVVVADSKKKLVIDTVRHFDQFMQASENAAAIISKQRVRIASAWAASKICDTYALLAGVHLFFI